jgi:hypothetical protein
MAQQQLTRKQRGLGKYDAPLKFQHEKGYNVGLTKPITSS